MTSKEKKFGIRIWFKQFLNVESKFNLSQIQNKILESSFIILGASMNFLTIFENAQVLQVNEFWKLSKMTIFKLYELMLSKTFYFATPIFVELLHVMGRLHEFSRIL